MKKFKIFLTCFVCLYLIAWTYLDIVINLQSVYWLAGKLIGLLVIFSGFLFIENGHKKNNKLSFIFRLCFAIIFIGYWAYHDIAQYKGNLCQDKFGREFNVRRRSLGIPELPADWHIGSRLSWSVDWQAKDGVIGHESKIISIDSSCVIKFEYDEYYLKPVHGISRDVSITTHYAKGKSKDSIFFYYEVGSDSRTITRKQADSIFAAEKIRKDY